MLNFVGSCTSTRYLGRIIDLDLHFNVTDISWISVLNDHSFNCSRYIFSNFTILQAVSHEKDPGCDHLTIMYSFNGTVLVQS